MATSTNLYNNFSVFMTFVMAAATLATAFFAYFQYKINERMKKLADYVAINLVPMPPGDVRLQILNVGKINLYLQKYQIGTNHESFAKSVLIPSGSNSFLVVPIVSYVSGQSMDVTLYLTDELGEKFVSTGEVIIENVPATKNKSVTNPDGTLSTTTISTFVPQSVAKAYKTMKRSWEL